MLRPFRTGEGSRMSEVEKPVRENRLPLAVIQSLLTRVLGAPLPDRLVSWLGVSRRNADRWTAGASTYPPAVLEKLETLAPLCDEMIEDFQDLVEAYVALGVPENLIRLRMREFSKTLTEEPPARPMPPDLKQE